MNRKFSIICIFILISFLSFAMYPFKEYLYSPETVFPEGQNLSFMTDDSIQIASWYHPALKNKNKNVSMIISYGNMGNMSLWFKLGGALASQGFDVWLYDYRGFGKSDDYPIDYDSLYHTDFLLDLKTVVRNAKEAYPNNKIALLGLSTGSIICMKYLRQDPDIDFYIGDGHIYAPQTMADKINAMGDNCYVNKNTSIKNWNTFYKKNTVPFLIFSGSDDEFCSQDEMNTLIKNVKDLTIVPLNGGHLWNACQNEDEYAKNIAAFIDHRLN